MEEDRLGTQTAVFLQIWQNKSDALSWNLHLREYQMN